MYDIYEMLAATYAVLDQEMSDLGIKAVANDLKGYEHEAIATALTRCRKELRRMTLADIIQRIPGEHPGAEEAWAVVAQCLNNESVSVCWTQQMANAYGVAYNVGDDVVAGRMAFKEAYLREVSQARANNEKPVWFASYGTDSSAREKVMHDASKMNLLVNRSVKQLTKAPDFIS